jgi:hypothetical protein
VIAIEKGVKSRVYSELTENHKLCQKPELFNGFNKIYQALSEDGDKLPSESKRVQFKVGEIMKSTRRSMTELFDVTAAKDWANTQARASVVVDEHTALLDQVPVTYLLFLEKQLNDIKTFIEKLPELDENSEWSFESESGLYKTKEVETHRSKKVVKPIVKYDATKEHPAQTDLIQVDVLDGYWKKVDHSGAIAKTEKAEMLERVEKLIKAVKFAREEANVEEADKQSIGDKIFEYIGF